MVCETQDQNDSSEYLANSGCGFATRALGWLNRRKNPNPEAFVLDRTPFVWIVTDRARTAGLCNPCRADPGAGIGWHGEYL